MAEADYIPRQELWNMYNDHIVQGRHHETQRSTMLGIVLTLATALVGISALDHTLAGKSDALIGSIIIALGVFGAGFTFKHYERYCFHMMRARGFRRALDATLVGNPIESIQNAADAAHGLEFPRVRKMRLHYWWIFLNIVIAVVGTFVLMMAWLLPMERVT